MAVHMSLGGNAAGDGFLLAPLATTYDAPLALWTDDGTASVTLQASPNAAGLVFSQTALTLYPTPTVVNVHATLQSGSRGDTTIQAIENGAVVASFTVTAIKHPVVHFRGRFQARFATQSADYNQNPFYTATSEAVGPGWTWGLEGEPPFVPEVNIPENLETPVGRVIRFNNPVALRSYADPVVSTVNAISGETAAGVETFLAGDPLIGQPVDLGPNTYFAGNRNINQERPNDPLPEEFYNDAFEPMGLFELHLGAFFSGASKVGPFTHKATTIDERTREPDSRPIATGLVNGQDVRDEIGLPDLQTFSGTRIDALLADFLDLPPGDSPDRRNLVRRIGHLLGSVSPQKRAQVLAEHPGVFQVRAGTIQGGWFGKEVFNGKVDANLQFQPGDSSVAAYLSDFPSFHFQSHFFAFHSDELCAHHKGTLNADLNLHGAHSGDPHTRTVDGTAYDFPAVGEFTLLRDGAGMEIQVRQRPVVTEQPVADPYTGLTSCVSVITAVAARVGSHRIALQPNGEEGNLQFFLDGAPASLSGEGIDLDGNRVAAFAADGETGLRVDFANQTVLTVTPYAWSSQKLWPLNVSVSQTKADEGIMGFIPKESWLPRLRNGETVGPMPDSLHDRHVALFTTFADSWRVTEETSLFVYAPGESTSTYTDADWPVEEGTCNLKPGFAVAGTPIPTGLARAEAEQLCQAITEDDLRRDCVVDVAATGDATFANGYRQVQDLRLLGTAVTISTETPLPMDREDHPVHVEPHSLIVMATVLPLTPGRPIPTGSVTVFVDGVPQGEPARLDSRGQARVTVAGLTPGESRIHAVYAGGGAHNNLPSASASLVYANGRRP